MGAALTFALPPMYLIVTFSATEDCCLTGRDLDTSGPIGDWVTHDAEQRCSAHVGRAVQVLGGAGDTEKRHGCGATAYRHERHHSC